MKNKKKNNEDIKKSSHYPAIEKLKKDLLMLKIVNSKGYLKKTHLINQKKIEIARLLTEKNKLKRENN